MARAAKAKPVRLTIEQPPKAKKAKPLRLTIEQPPKAKKAKPGRLTIEQPPKAKKAKPVRLTIEQTPNAKPVRRGRPPAGIKPGEESSKYPALIVRLPPAMVKRVKAAAKQDGTTIWRWVYGVLDAHLTAIKNAAA
jgi:hypothetical protein